MSISIGGINLADELLNTMFRVGVLEKIVEHLLNNKPVTPQDLENFRSLTISDLQKKYPEAGIEKR